MIYIGTNLDIQLPEGGCLVIDDEIRPAPDARVFDPIHAFNPLDNLDYRKAADIVDVFDALFSRGDSTLTKDTGLDEIAAALEKNPTRLDALLEPPDKQSTTGHIWAYGKIRRLMRSPVLYKMLCPQSGTTFSFNKRSTILARVNRAELGEFDALAVGLFLMTQFKGTVVIPDFGFYGRDTHAQLIRENRLIAGVRFLDELPPGLRRHVLAIEDKTIAGALYDDAVLLAKHAGLHPDPSREDNDYNKFIEAAMKPPEPSAAPQLWTPPPVKQRPVKERKPRAFKRRTEWKPGAGGIG